jgi:sugar phosphate isomerase/epimerase
MNVRASPPIGVEYFMRSTNSVLSMNQVTTYRWTLEEDIHYYREAGYEAIGVWRQKLDDYDELIGDELIGDEIIGDELARFGMAGNSKAEKGAEPGVDLIAESGLRVTNLQWAGGFTGSDGRSYSESIEDAVTAVRLAGRLGAGCLVIYSGGRNHHTIGHARRLLEMAMDRLLELAEPADVVLAVEPMHAACASDWTFLTEIESAIHLIEHFSSPNLKLVLDTYHFGHDRDMLDRLADLVPYIALVQLGDRRHCHTPDQERCSLGSGDVPLADIVHGLLAAGYNGDFDVELSGSDIEMVDYTQLLLESRQYFDHLLSPVSEC